MQDCHEGDFKIEMRLECIGSVVFLIVGIRNIFFKTYDLEVYCFVLLFGT